MQYTLYILLAIVMFGALIAVHEFGHFIAAKLFGVRVNEFSIGMGPLLLHRQGKETEYSLRALPIGGFCAMEGEDEASDDPRSFTCQRAWKRFIILVAGAAMNLVAGVLILVVLMGVNRSFLVPVVATAEPGFPQGESSLQVGDRILKIDGRRVFVGGDVNMLLSRAADPITVEVERNGRHLVLTDCLTIGEYPDKTGEIRLRYGFSIGRIEATPALCLQQTWLNTVNFARLVWMGLSDLVTGAAGLRDLSGPIGIVETIGSVGAQSETAGIGLYNVFWFVALIAINLAVMNLLPIPALDGGRIFFLLVEGVFWLFTRRKPDPKWEGWIHTGGFVLLMGLMLLIAASDILRLMGV